MIIFLYNLLVFLHALYFVGNTYAAVKFYSLKHRWSPYLAITFTGNALFGLSAFITSGFGPRPTSVVWWVITVTIAGRIVKVVGITVLTFFLLGWINGVGSFAKKEEPKDAA